MIKNCKPDLVLCTSRVIVDLLTKQDDFWLPLTLSNHLRKKLETDLGGPRARGTRTRYIADLHDQELLLH